MQLDFSRDYLQWNNTRPIRLESVRRYVAPPDQDPLLQAGPQLPPRDSAAALDAGSFEVIPIAKKRNLTRRELAASGGAYSAADVVWLIPTALVSSGRPLKLGDVVEDDNPQNDTADRWTIIELGQQKNGWTYRAVTRDLSVVYDLRDTINVERPRISYDTAGATILAFPSDAETSGGEILYGNLVCKVQPTTQEIVTARGITGTEQHYDIFCSRQINVVQYDRIAWTVGNLTTYLDILAVRHPQEITELPVIEAVRKV